MKTLGDLIGHELKWVQPRRLNRRFELRAGDEVLATLSWQKKWGSLAVAETAGGQWTLKRSGFLRPRVTVRPAGSEADLALFAAGWWGDGVLEVVGGSRFFWKPTNFWRSEWVWSSSDGIPLLRIKAKARLVRMQGRLNVEPTAGSVPELMLLAVVGWYLLVLMSEEAASAAVIG